MRRNFILFTVFASLASLATKTFHRRRRHGPTGAVAEPPTGRARAGTAPGRPRGRARLSATLVLVLLASLVAVMPAALAEHGLSSLPGSNFEIDDDANITRQHDGMDDWATVAAAIQPDLPSGQDDDSLKGNENTACPEPTTGGIQNNKSDLQEFGIYIEPHPTDATHPGFLNLFWSRVQDPSGTTNISFEFNQSTDLCTFQKGKNELTGVTPQRTVDDLLITYDIDQGGSTAKVALRKWTGSAWGPEQSLGADAGGVGTINESAIAEVGDLGPYEPRTFGEAQIDLNVIFDPTSCLSFGSAFLKSRSSSSFSSSLSDFIAPRSVPLTNCGSIIVEKVDDATPANRLPGAAFTVTPGQTSNGSTATSSGVPAVTSQTGLFCVDKLLLGVEYTIAETVVPDGFVGASDQEFTVRQASTCAERINNGSGADLTFVNTPARRNVTLIKRDDADPAQPLGGVGFTLFEDTNKDGTWQETETTAAASGTTAADGALTLSNVLLGHYCLVETTTPSGYTTIDPVCFPLVQGPGAFTVPTSLLVNPRKHRIVVLVCHEGSDTLYPSDVTLGGDPKRSLAAGALTVEQQKALCDLGGASFGNIAGHGTHAPSVNLGAPGH